MTIPGHLPWVVHRIAVSPHYRDSLHAIFNEWSLMDVCDANAVIDAIESAMPQKD